MQLIFILGASSTRRTLILHIKACHMQPVSPFQFQKSLVSPSRFRLSHFLTCQHVILAICLVPCCDLSGLTYLTHQG